MASEISEASQSLTGSSSSNSYNSTKGAGVDDENSLDVDTILQGFNECLKEDSLLLDGYIRAYTEITKLLASLGAVFSFVTSDVQSKLNTLRCYRKGGAGDCYYSIQSMLEYEKDQTGLTNPSGSRTLLRLHRALEFIRGFIEAATAAEADANLGPLVQPVYSQTLAKHHSWLVSKSVSAVLLLLPNKKTFMTKLVGNDDSKYDSLHSKSPELVKMLQQVYDATQTFYCDYDMLNLP